MSLQTGTEMISIALLINKVTGVYGLLAILTGYALDGVQLSMYIYSVAVLGALAFVAWRVWGRKKTAEDSDGLINYDPATGMEKSDAGSVSAVGSTRSPFQSTLENYHRPTHNASANF